MQRKFRFLKATALGAAGLMALAACAGGAAESAPAADDSSAPADAAAETLEYDIAVVRWDAGDIFFNGVQAGEEMAIAQLAEMGVKVNFKVVAANDAGQQIDGLRALMAQGIDGVSLVPWRGDSMRDLVNELTAEGIPVVVHNLTVPEQEVPFVAFDNVDAGRLAGDVIVENIKKARGDSLADGGVILVLRGDVTASFDRDRAAGLNAAYEALVAEYPNIEIVERADLGYQAEPARKAVEDAITRYGAENILAVSSVDGTMAVGGTIPALQAAGLSVGPGDTAGNVPVSSIDCSRPELDSIAAGELTHCSQQPAIAEGVLVLYLLYDMIKNGATTPSDDVLSLIEGWDDVPWAPVTVESRDDIAGPWYRTNAFAVPSVVPVENPYNWADAADIAGD
jgi:ABC-type sugar transport system substrate-binding protein